MECNNTYADNVFDNLVVDRGSSKRTGFGIMYKENDYWYFVDDFYLRYKK